MTTATIAWDRIEQFVGFGRLSARVLFIGMEEGLLPGTDLLADLQMRSGYDRCMDLFEAQRGLKDCMKYFGPGAVTQRTWRPMCHLMLRLEGKPSTKERRAEYQAWRLGRKDGDTLLAELMPYPSHDKISWPYGNVGRFPTRAAYDDVMRPERVKMFQQLITQQRYEIAVCYGKADWPLFKEIFKDIAWESDGLFERGTFNQTRVLLAPHFSSRAFNTDEQLEQFSRAALI